MKQLSAGPWMRTSGLTDAEWILFTDGVKEPRSVAFVSELLQPGMTAIDVGANVGYYTLILASAVGSTGAVHSFEPTPALAERLRLNVSLNGFSHVTTNASAVADRQGMASLHISSADLEANSLFGIDESVKQISVPLVTLDAYVAANSIQKVDLIKIDCEGSELKVLQGASTLLQSEDAPMLLIESNPETLALTSTTVGDLYRYLRSRAYRCYALEQLTNQSEPVWNLFAAKESHRHRITSMAWSKLQEFEPTAR